MNPNRQDDWTGDLQDILRAAGKGAHDSGEGVHPDSAPNFCHDTLLLFFKRE